MQNRTFLQQKFSHNRVHCYDSCQWGRSLLSKPAAGWLPWHQAGCQLSAPRKAQLPAPRGLPCRQRAPAVPASPHGFLLAAPSRTRLPSHPSEARAGHSGRSMSPAPIAQPWAAVTPSRASGRWRLGRRPPPPPRAGRGRAEPSPAAPRRAAREARGRPSPQVPRERGGGPTRPGGRRAGLCLRGGSPCSVPLRP